MHSRQPFSPFKPGISCPDAPPGPGMAPRAQHTASRHGGSQTGCFRTRIEAAAAAGSPPSPQRCATKTNTAHHVLSSTAKETPLTSPAAFHQLPEVSLAPPSPFLQPWALELPMAGDRAGTDTSGTAFTYQERWHPAAQKGRVDR